MQDNVQSIGGGCKPNKYMLSMNDKVKERAAQTDLFGLEKWWFNKYYRWI
jgi:hypothetical protein